MNDLPFHLLLFAVAGTVIVVISAFFSEPEDSAALRAIPRRLFWFFVGCAGVAAVMLVCEHTFARVGSV